VLCALLCNIFLDMCFTVCLYLHFMSYPLPQEFTKRKLENDRSFYCRIAGVNLQMLNACFPKFRLVNMTRCLHSTHLLMFSSLCYMLPYVLYSFIIILPKQLSRFQPFLNTTTYAPVLLQPLMDFMLFILTYTYRINSLTLLVHGRPFRRCKYFFPSDCRESEGDDKGVWGLGGCVQSRGSVWKQGSGGVLVIIALIM